MVQQMHSLPSRLCCEPAACALSIRPGIALRVHAGAASGSVTLVCRRALASPASRKSRKSGRWRAKIQIDSFDRHLGYFHTQEEVGGWLGGCNCPGLRSASGVQPARLAARLVLCMLQKARLPKGTSHTAERRRGASAPSSTATARLAFPRTRQVGGSLHRTHSMHCAPLHPPVQAACAYDAAAIKFRGGWVD